MLSKRATTKENLDQGQGIITEFHIALHILRSPWLGYSFEHGLLTWIRRVARGWSVVLTVLATARSLKYESQMLKNGDNEDERAIPGQGMIPHVAALHRAGMGDSHSHMSGPRSWQYFRQQYGCLWKTYPTRVEMSTSSDRIWFFLRSRLKRRHTAPVNPYSRPTVVCSA